jgi:hypothetical protein
MGSRWIPLKAIPVTSTQLALTLSVFTLPQAQMINLFESGLLVNNPPNFGTPGGKDQTGVTQAGCILHPTPPPTSCSFHQQRIYLMTLTFSLSRRPWSPSLISQKRDSVIGGRSATPPSHRHPALLFMFYGDNLLTYWPLNVVLPEYYFEHTLALLLYASTFQSHPETMWFCRTR